MPLLPFRRRTRAARPFVPGLSAESVASLPPAEVSRRWAVAEERAEQTARDVAARALAARVAALPQPKPAPAPERQVMAIRLPKPHKSSGQFRFTPEQRDLLVRVADAYDAGQRTFAGLTSVEVAWAHAEGTRLRRLRHTF